MAHWGHRKNKIKIEKKRGKVAGEKQFPNSRELIRSTVAGWIRSSIRSTCFLPNDTHPNSLQVGPRVEADARPGPSGTSPRLFVTPFVSAFSRKAAILLYSLSLRETPATPERVHSIKRRRFDRFIIDTNRAPFCFSLMLPLHSRKH